METAKFVEIRGEILLLWLAPHVGTLGCLADLVVDAPPMTCAEAVLPVFCNGSLRGWFLKWLLVVEAPSTRVEDSRILVVNGSDDLCGGGPRGYCIRFSIPYAGAGSLGMAVDSLMAHWWADSIALW